MRKKEGKKWLPLVCPNCRLHTNEELKKYQWIRIEGCRNIVLKRVALTVFACPKCGSSFVDPAFKDEKAAEKIRQERAQKRVEQLRHVYSSKFSFCFDKA